MYCFWSFAYTVFVSQKIEKHVITVLLPLFLFQNGLIYMWIADGWYFINVILQKIVQFRVSKLQIYFFNDFTFFQSQHLFLTYVWVDIYIINI